MILGDLTGVKKFTAGNGSANDSRACVLVCVRAIQDSLVVVSRASKRVISYSTASVSSLVSVFGHGNSASYWHLTCERTFCPLGGFSLTGRETP